MKIRFELDVPDSWIGLTPYDLRRKWERSVNIKYEVLEKFAGLIVAGLKVKSRALDVIPKDKIEDGNPESSTKSS